MTAFCENLENQKISSQTWYLFYSHLYTQYFSLASHFTTYKILDKNIHIKIYILIWIAGIFYTFQQLSVGSRENKSIGQEPITVKVRILNDMMVEVLECWDLFMYVWQGGIR